MSNRYDVNIAGYTLTISTDRSEERVRRLGEMVNERVREIQKGGSTANYLNAILLASITLADELLEVRERGEAERLRRDQAGRSLMEVLDSALEK